MYKMLVKEMLLSTDLLQFNSKIIHFFIGVVSPFDRQNGICSRKNNRKDKEFECNFLIICRYL